MPQRLSSSPSARTFAEALRREILQPAARTLAGRDGVLTAAEAGRASRVLSGREGLAADLFEQMSARLRGAPAEVDAAVEAAVEEVAALARQAAGPDGRLSGADVQKLPPHLQAAFSYLRSGALPIGELRYSESVLQDVLRTHGLSDREALLRRAAELDDGNGYLNRPELTAAAASLLGPRDSLSAAMPADWRQAIEGELPAGHLQRLSRFIDGEYARHTIYPPKAELFTALERTPLEKVKVVLIGQDPYHGPGEAHGLSFSVKDGVKVPPSLRNIYRELHSDLGAPPPDHGNLEEWADQGVLLLNAVLTVREKSPASHRGQGWEEVTTAMLKKVNQKDEKVVFLLLGADAQKMAPLIDTSKHTIVRAAHPSPLSSSRFLGSRPFSQVNAALREAGRGEIDWRLSGRR
jgi:uracil-DNA glycosylase